jgi:predicted RNase H-like nuclease (RuvC/YqgF family)
VSSCSRCNYGLGRKVAVENGRQEIERLRDAIWQQAQEIEQLRDTIAQLEKPRPMPAIH